MKPAELRKALRKQKRELRGQLAAFRRQSKHQLDQRPEVRRARTRRRMRRLLTVALLLLLALFAQCDCGKGPPAVKPPAPPVMAEPQPKLPVPTPKSHPPPFRTEVDRQPRGRYPSEASAPATWLDEYRLQVSARSVRLAQCFSGTDRPGALRWTAAVNPKSGGVSDHELEPVGPTADLNAEQRECLVRTLSNPTYRLTPPEDSGLPNRITLVLEF